LVFKKHIDGASFHFLFDFGITLAPFFAVKFCCFLMEIASRFYDDDGVSTEWVAVLDVLCRRRRLLVCVLCVDEEDKN